MELRERLRRWAYARPRVLVVDAAGRDVLRWAVEAAIDDRGWEFATSPAGTDVLVVLGEAAPALADAIDVLWSQVPGPRSTVTIADPALVDQQLDAAVAGLVPVPATGAVHPPVPDPADRPAAAHQPSGGDAHTAQDMGEHSGHEVGGEHSGHDMGGDGGHHGHHGGVVAGLPMAQTAPDRDGLELDTLAVALGPVLPGWPTGLVLHAQLHGDVLSDVRSSWIAGVPGAPGATPTTSTSWRRSTTSPASWSSRAGRRRPGTRDGHWPVCAPPTRRCGHRQQPRRRGWLAGYVDPASWHGRCAAWGPSRRAPAWGPTPGGHEPAATSWTG